jgi:hypothetical protein
MVGDGSITRNRSRIHVFLLPFALALRKQSMRTALGLNAIRLGAGQCRTETHRAALTARQAARMIVAA